jgi:hypothetical protein
MHVSGKLTPIVTGFALLDGLCHVNCTLDPDPYTPRHCDAGHPTSAQ